MNDRPTVAAGTVLVLSYPAAVVAALWPSAGAFFAIAFLGYVIDAVVFRRMPAVSQRLSSANAGPTLRFAIRELALLLLLIRTGHAGEAGFVALAAGLFGLHVIRGAVALLSLYVTRRRRLPLLTRGFDLSELAIPDAPGPLLTTRQTRTMLNLDVLPVVGAVFGIGAGLGGLAAAYALALAAFGVLAGHVRRNRHLGDDNRMFKIVNRQLAALQPEVVLYHSGSPSSAYQANMWLSTLDALDRRTLIVLRERSMIRLLDRTRTPVICVPNAVDLVRLDLSSVGFALFPANVGKNLHMLRIPTIRSVFINHGDSDKPASFNPFAKAYDEVWVAGPAGRDRYLNMRTGVRDEDIVEVGRPQLAPIDTSGSTPDPVFTVLYAPTWEGWSDDLVHSSVASMGPRIVRMLLEHMPQVRVLYKPHPLTGNRDPRAVEAHNAIVAMIDKANATREGGDTAHADRLASLTRRLDAMAGAEAAGGDEAQAARDAGRPTSPEAWDQAETEWGEAYWRAEGPFRHRVITGPRPHVYDCFNHADLLITDISSVAGDFIASGKPFAVTNVGGLNSEEFRELFPTAAAAAYLISPDCGELAKILAEAQAEGPDSLAERRRDFKHHLLGPDEPDAMTRFAAAADTILSEFSNRSRRQNASPSLDRVVPEPR